jgi:peptidoglycan/LPS O-acetylase OafA/YrhL
MTLSERLDQASGRPAGFDYVRLILACSVLVWHSIVTSYGNAAQDEVQVGPWRPLVSLILPMFFALSGFLVAGSLERSRSLIGFLGLRVIRIYPALTAEVLLSALILGPLQTTLPLPDYFTDATFFRYLVNVTGHISYELPGVFLDNPNPQRVNGQLWTVPFELLCYIALAGLAALGLSRRPAAFTVGIAALWVAALGYFIARHGWGEDRPPTGLPGLMLIVTFLFGIALYLWRDRMAWNAPLGVACAAIGVTLLWFPPFGDFLAPLPIAYVTIWLGLMNPRRVSVLKTADYSYGIFLYGYAIQQAYMSIGPALHHPAINVALALPTTCACAALSWHLIERPALALRDPLRRLEVRYLGLRRRFLPVMPDVLATRLLARIGQRARQHAA